MGRRKTLQELTIKDNFMFGAVMVDEELCKEFLELVLGFRISKVTVCKEKSMVYHPEYRGIRLDITAADEKSTHYNVEMQVKRRKNLGKRSRYYHSQIDMELLNTGLDYDLLPDSYVIFLCDFDPFFQNKYRYTFDMVCREDDKISLEDGSHTIFLSTHGKNEEEVSSGLVRFLEYVKSDTEETEAEDDFVKRVQEAVRKVKKSREMEDRYMTLEELIKEEREEAKEEGRTEGQRDMILKRLSLLGEVPEELQEKIRSEKDEKVLYAYVEAAFEAKTIEEFIQKMK